MDFILTEKPSVAADFAKALNCSKNVGFYDSRDFTIGYCFGHLLTSAEPDSYDPNYKKWNIEQLPVMPEPFRYEPLPKTQNQLLLIKRLLSQNVYSRIIIATDAGREGEFIGRLVLEYCGVLPSAKNRVFRFWTSEALEPQSVLNGLSRLRPIQDYDFLYAQARARNQADWIVGINYTRFFTLRLSSSSEAGVFSFGRVQTAILFLLCALEMTIRSFVTRALFGIDFFSGIHFMYQFIENNKPVSYIDSKSTALSFLKSMVSSITIQNISSTEKSFLAPRLPSLSTIQQSANKAFSFTATHTLSLCQELYESYKCISYPRTASRSLSRSNVSYVEKIFNSLKRAYPQYFEIADPLLIDGANDRIFTDVLEDDHHALIPLSPLPSSATGDIALIYNLILSFFIAAFSPPYKYTSICITGAASGVPGVFVSRGKKVIQDGWKKAFGSIHTDEETDEQIIDLNFSPGQILSGQFSLVSKQTTPPSRYSEASLLAVLEHPSRVDDTIEKTISIGTPATRSDIIEGLVRHKFIERKKTSLLPSAKGLFYYESLSSLSSIGNFTNFKTTASWEGLLASNAQQFLSDVKNTIRSSIQHLKNNDFQSFTVKHEVMGMCPSCHSGEIIVSKNRYSCRSCSYSLPRVFAGTTLSSECIGTILSGKQSRPLFFLSKSGIKFRARLAIKDLKFTFIPVESSSKHT